MAMELQVPYVGALQEERGGFRFEHPNSLASRWKALPQAEQDVHTMSGVNSSGTTIVGLLTKEGVVLAADSRSTSGLVVADPACMKLHPLAANMYAAGAGVAADLDRQMHLFKSIMELERLRTGRPVRVVSLVSQLSQKLLRYGGHIAVALIIGGVDCTGMHLIYVAGGGSWCAGPYLCMGSGGLSASSFLAGAWREGLTLEEGKQMAARAVRQGVLNDPYSGSFVNVVSIDLQGKATMFYKFEDYSQVLREPAPGPCFARGTTTVLHEKEIMRRIEGVRAAVQIDDETVMRDE